MKKHAWSILCLFIVKSIFDSSLGKILCHKQTGPNQKLEIQFANTDSVNIKMLACFSADTN